MRGRVVRRGFHGRGCTRSQGRSVTCWHRPRVCKIRSRSAPPAWWRVGKLQDVGQCRPRPRSPRSLRRPRLLLGGSCRPCPGPAAAAATLTRERKWNRKVLEGGEQSPGQRGPDTGAKTGGSARVPHPAPGASEQSRAGFGRNERIASQAAVAMGRTARLTPPGGV